MRPDVCSSGLTDEKPVVTKAEVYLCTILCFDMKDTKSRSSSSGTITEYKTV